MNDGGSEAQETIDRQRKTVDAAKERLAGYSRVIGGQALGQADAGLERAAHVIDSAADRLRERAAEQDGVKRKVGETAATGVASAGHFLHEHSVSEVGAAGTVVRGHPFMALFAGLLIGFLLGRLLSGD